MTEISEDGRMVIRTFSGVLRASAGSQHTVRGAVRAGGTGTLVVEECTPLGGDCR